jgi:hypothetical protein
MINTLYLGTAGTVSLDIREDGHLVGVNISSNDAAPGTLEVSFNSSPSFSTNDTTGVIAGTFLTGSGTLANNTRIALREPVSVGERIFLHMTGLNQARVFLYTETSGAASRAAVRRR